MDADYADYGIESLVVSMYYKRVALGDTTMRMNLIWIKK